MFDTGAGEGLGWLRFLRENGLGGVLADDMGLGKTVQALAHLEFRRQAGAGPSLVVMPRSLLHNWKVEAERLAHDTEGVRRVINLIKVGDHT